MKNKVVEVLENQMISEPELINLVHIVYKLTKVDIMKKKDLESICDTLGIKQIEKNIFELDENNAYIFEK